MLNMVSTATLAMIEGLINQALKQDPVTQAKLSKLEGKVIALTLKQPKVTIYGLFQHDSIRLMNNYECVPELAITGATFDFLQLALADDHNSALFSSRIRMDGDEHLAQKLMTIALGLSIDWEYLLSKITGDVIAHQIGQGVRASTRWIKDTHQSMTANLEEYIHHELRTLPHASEVDYYCEQVTSLRLASDRLMARVKALESPSSSNSNKESPSIEQNITSQGELGDES
ncbi:SCP2 domain-containing protein [Litoribrevibacter euphylliae]|uniref:Ubiquinone biosynthesis accessory factor UbiJ n=1 Tax=Litoribrevibacter euphylliae TaxID=1834034 RepID=A0ABV7HER2_9GAMM